MDTTDGISCRRLFQQFCTFAGSLPKSLSEQIQVLIAAGFGIANKKLQEAIKDLASKRWRELEERMRIGIPCSTVALMVADFTGILEEGQVHLSFSTAFDGGDQFHDTLLEGCDVLVARNPAHLPSDVQKVHAVSRAELRHLKDVIVFSTKGNTPLASLLSGGDYDGDIAWVCWDKAIVSNFTATPLPPRPSAKSPLPLRKTTTKLSDLYNISQSESTEQVATDFLTRGLAFNSRQSLLGICTNYKESLCYKYNSISCAKAINMSFLLSDLVDQSKQGTIFTTDDWRAFQKNVLDESSGLTTPAYANNHDESNGHLIRPTQHVLDFLKDVCSNVARAARQKIDSAIPDYEHDRDLTELARFYNDKQCPVWKAVLRHIRTELSKVVEVWHEMYATKKNDDDGGDDGRRAVYDAFLRIQPPPEYADHDQVTALLQPHIKDQAMTEWSLLKASELYKRHGKSSWIWYAAGRQLCALKVRQRQCSDNSAAVSVVPHIYSLLKPNKKRIQRLMDTL